MPGIGVVVIGRNEGNRLQHCLSSGIRETPVVLYVDSGSSDDSLKLARSLGIEAIELDPLTPFSAARARNEGFRRLLQLQPDLGYVQFVDGDCELRAGWLASAVRFLGDHADVAVVSGRLREKYAAKSIYNALCDIEWEAPAGAVKECGGIAMMRASAFDRAGGFRIDLIAGEEPELCVRLRMQGWKIWRLEQEMALHDAAMSRFSQWWKRTKRGGYAIAQGTALHGAPPERYGVRESRSILLWGLVIPLVALGLLPLIGTRGLLVLTLYPLQVIRLALSGPRSARENWLNAIFLVIGKFPAMLGLLQYHIRRGLGLQPRLIEHK
jgi:GT2 family glycosyltransferase